MLIIALLVIVCIWFFAPVEHFSQSNSTGFLYSKPGCEGGRIGIGEGQQYILWDPNNGWNIWSGKVPNTWVFRIYADRDSPDQIYLRNPGRIDNLPAAIGGLPSEDQKSKVFGTGRPVFVEISHIDAAERQIKHSHKQCIEQVGRDSYCTDEYTSLL